MDINLFLPFLIPIGFLGYAVIQLVRIKREQKNFQVPKGFVKSFYRIKRIKSFSKEEQITAYKVWMVAIIIYSLFLFQFLYLLDK